MGSRRTENTMLGRKQATAGLIVGALGVLVSLTWPWGAALSPSSLSRCPLFIPPADEPSEASLLSAWTAYQVFVAPIRRIVFAVEGLRAQRDADGARLFTGEELRAYDGSRAFKPILLAVAGDVFDVTDLGAHFYGVGAPYHVFAGRDSTRALALGTLDNQDVSMGGHVEDLTETQKTAVLKQLDFYRSKYKRVGRLVATPLHPGEMAAHGGEAAVQQVGAAAGTPHAATTQSGDGAPTTAPALST